MKNFIEVTDAYGQKKCLISIDNIMLVESFKAMGHSGNCQIGLKGPYQSIVVEETYEQVSILIENSQE